MSCHGNSEYNDLPIKFSPLCWGTASTSSEPNTSAVEQSQRRKAMKNVRSRVSKACKRCRLRKIKCDGGRPCVRCSEADDVCEYAYRWKKESKEYSQGYIDQILEQNDRYKRAMRLLYANRRLSIQPDNMVLPSTDGQEVPLVHDILDRLGLLTSRMGIDHANLDAREPSEAEKQRLEKLEDAGVEIPMSKFEYGSSQGDTISESLPVNGPLSYDDYFGNLAHYTAPREAESPDNSDSEAPHDLVFAITLDGPQMAGSNKARQDYFDLANYAEPHADEDATFYDPDLMVPLMGDLYGASAMNDFWFGAKEYSMAPAPFASF